ncbi:Cupin domain [Raoultella terrigena]|nr:Cupin domain [Raoultella terrigena]
MFIFHKETTLDDLGNGVTRRILAHDGKMMAVEVNFDAGAIGPMHNHPHEQLTYVLSGEFEFTIGDEKHVVSAGDTLYKQPHIMHGCVCLKAGTLLDTFTPVSSGFSAKLIFPGRGGGRAGMLPSFATVPPSRPSLFVKKYVQRQSLAGQ